MSEVETQYVKRGYWVNVEHGSVIGRTITTDIRTGTVTIALLAILVTLATSHLWNLIVFGIHQLRADGRPADGLFRQQQALLRTASAPTSMLADWIKLWWVWRKRSERALSRSILQLGIVGLFAAATVVAGVFSSYAVDTTNLHVLVHNPDCGPFDSGDGDTFSAGNLASLDYMSKVEARSVPYAQECYVNSTSLPARCHAFIKPSTPLTPERIDCPFQKDICIDYPQPGVGVDSGLVDANDIFGWNLGSRDRVKFRRKAMCGIVKTDGYQTLMNASDYPYNSRDLLPGEQNLAAHYGLRRNMGDWANLTFAQSLALANVTRSYTAISVVKWGATERDEISVFDPLPELQASDADVVLVLLTKNAMKYADPVEDPVFSAHKPFLYKGNAEQNMTVYFSDWPNSILGCKQQPGGVMNISVLGLAIVITFTTLVTLADLILLKFLVYVGRIRKTLSPRIDRWIQDGVFQLQRRAYEANDEGIWERHSKEVPATMEGQLLEVLGDETRRSCCTHMCARKGGDIVRVKGEMGLRRGVTVFSEATTVGEGSLEDISLKKGKVGNTPDMGTEEEK